MLNQYLTNIFTTMNNLYNLYFNLRGEGSNSIRKDILSDIKEFNNMYINLSLLIKKIGGFPIMSLSDINKISTIKQISSKDYTPESTIKIILNDLNIINRMNNQVGEYSLKNFDFKSINLVLEFNKYLENRLQILNSN